MFGLSFGELVVVIIVGVVVIGPKELPRVLRQAGLWAGRLRRMASDLRVQSGIDEVLREGSIRQDIEEIRKLARGELDVMQRQMRLEAPAATLSAGSTAALAPLGGYDSSLTFERELPKDGVDVYAALPDTAIVYDGNFPPSKWANDETYMLEDAVKPAVADDAPVDAPADEASGEPS